MLAVATVSDETNGVEFELRLLRAAGRMSDDRFVVARHREAREKESTRHSHSRAEIFMILNLDFSLGLPHYASESLLFYFQIPDAFQQLRVRSPQRAAFNGAFRVVSGRG